MVGCLAHPYAHAWPLLFALRAAVLDGLSDESCGRLLDARSPEHSEKGTGLHRGTATGG